MWVTSLGLSQERRPVRAYCDHGALTPAVRELSRNGVIELVKFPYDPGSYTKRSIKVAVPSHAQIRDLNLPISELPSTLNAFEPSAKLEEIRNVLGLANRRDALHLDSAYKSNCKMFFTCDKGILKHSECLRRLLSMQILHPDVDRIELERAVREL